MRKRLLRAVFLFVVAGWVPVSCGGKVVGAPPGGGSGDDSSSGASSSGGSSGSTSSGGGSSGGSSSGVVSSSSGSSSGGSSGSSSGASSGSSGGASCVFVDLSTYDRSCQHASDCISVLSGEVCSGDCDCNGVLVNRSEQGRFDQAVSSIEFGECGCPAEQGGVQCVDGTCTSESDGADAQAPNCVDIDLSTYDTSCQADSDCIDVTAGLLCSGQCSCGGSTINVDGEARYDAALSNLQLEACPCPSDGVLRCVQSQCTHCPLGPENAPGCDDDGG